MFVGSKRALPQEVRDSAARHRSPLLLRCMEDYLAGQLLPLSLICINPSVYYSISS